MAVNWSYSRIISGSCRSAGHQFKFKGLNSAANCYLRYSMAALTQHVEGVKDCYDDDTMHTL